jgi:hypothetical protein
VAITKPLLCDVEEKMEVNPVIVKIGDVTAPSAKNPSEISSPLPPALKSLEPNTKIINKLKAGIGHSA